MNARNEQWCFAYLKALVIVLLSITVVHMIVSQRQRDNSHTAAHPLAAHPAPRTNSIATAPPEAHPIAPAIVSSTTTSPSHASPSVPTRAPAPTPSLPAHVASSIASRPPPAQLSLIASDVAGVNGMTWLELLASILKHPDSVSTPDEQNPGETNQVVTASTQSTGAHPELSLPANTSSSASQISPTAAEVAGIDGLMFATSEMIYFNRFLFPDSSSSKQGREKHRGGKLKGDSTDVGGGGAGAYNPADADLPDIAALADQAQNRDGINHLTWSGAVPAVVEKELTAGGSSAVVQSGTPTDDVQSSTNRSDWLQSAIDTYALNQQVAVSHDEWVGGSYNPNEMSGIKLEVLLGGYVIAQPGYNWTYPNSFDLGGNRTFAVGGTVNYTGNISGANDSLIKTGSGTMILSGNNTFGGPSSTLSVNAGTVAFGSDTAAGDPGTVVLLNGGGVAAYGGPRTIDNTVVIAKSSSITGKQQLTFAGNIINEGGDHTLTVKNTGLTTFSGPSLVLADSLMPASLTLNVLGTSGGLLISSLIQDGAGPGIGTLVKDGTGTLILAPSGGNTFSGGLTVNAGTVIATSSSALGTGPVTVNGGTINVQAFSQALSIASSFQKAGNGNGNGNGNGGGNGPLTINSGGVLNGIGTLSSRVHVNSGGTVAPGNAGPGTLTTLDEDWNGGGILNIKVNDADGTPGSGWSLLSIAGNLTFNASGPPPVTIALSSLTLANTPGLVSDFTNTMNYSWTIISASQGITFKGGLNVNTAFAISTNGFANPLGTGSFRLSLANGGNDLVLTFTGGIPVPEPNAALMIGAGFLLMFARRRILRFNPPPHKIAQTRPVIPPSPNRAAAPPRIGMPSSAGPGELMPGGV